MIDGHDHSVAPNNGAADYITLFFLNEKLMIRSRYFNRKKERQHTSREKVTKKTGKTSQQQEKADQKLKSLVRNSKLMGK